MLFWISFMLSLMALIVSMACILFSPVRVDLVGLIE